MFPLPSLILGITAGLRTFTAPAAASWAARSGAFPVSNTPVAFLAHSYTPAILTLLALGEYVTDTLPTTPSRKTPPQFLARLISGSLVGTAAAAGSGPLLYGLLAGAVGATAGTYGGAALRATLASSFGEDLPAALLEDALAVGLTIPAVRNSAPLRP